MTNSVKTCNLLLKLNQNLILFVDLEDAYQIMLKSHSATQLIIQFHLLGQTQIFQEPLKTLTSLKECTIINGNLEHPIQRLNGIIQLKIHCITLNLNWIKI